MNDHTDLDTETATRLLAPLADLEPAGPPRTTVAGLVAGGRRRRRTRRTAAAGAIAGITALALIGGGLATGRWSPGWSPLGSVAPAASATGGEIAVTGPTVRLGTAPAAFDPATVQVTVGPPPSNDRSLWLDAHRQMLGYGGLRGPHGATGELTVELFPADGHWELPGLSNDTSQPPASKGVPAEGHPGPTIQGRPSRVLSDPTSATVLWQWAPHAWAAVWATDTTDPLTDVLRTVNDLTIGPGSPVVVPFTAARPPAGYPLRSVATYSRPGAYGAGLTFSDRASTRNDDLSTRALSYQLSSDPRRTGASPSTRYGPDIANPNTTLDGHPAYVHSDSDGSSAWLFDVGGSLLKVDSSYPGGTIDTTALARSITPVAKPTDPATWTTHPLR